MSPDKPQSERSEQPASEKPQPERPDQPKPVPSQPEQPYVDRVYRSPAGIIGGALLLALGLWIGLDGFFRGDGGVKLGVVAALLLVVPLVVAFTLRPAAVAGADRLRVRNPFRTISLPWAAVEDIRASYSSEVFADGRKFQIWAIPVSLRARKRVQRRHDLAAMKAEGGQQAGDEKRSAADQSIVELRELAERNAKRPTAQGSPQVRWAWEIIVPAVVGAVTALVLSVTG